ncbi:hypothetical protein [Longispora albida]|uniref:hypothetical protein n=1 Tax=Longispora albida TaxID=203523 RepID=UPI0003606676|nr:hypothetical protein [Longispora albida]
MYPQTPHQPAGLTLTTKYHWLTFMFALFKPKALINGHEAQLAWGDNHLPLPPGLHTIEVWIPYLWKVGSATIQVDTRSGQPVALFYSAPAIAFSGGALDYQQQKHPGMMLAILLMVVPLALVILCCCGSTLLSAMSDSSSY